MSPEDPAEPTPRPPQAPDAPATQSAPQSAPPVAARAAAVDQVLLTDDYAAAALAAAPTPRSGSPFAVDPPALQVRRKAQARGAAVEAGTWQVTAGGAVLAAVMLVFFAAAAAWSFPAGTAMTAALGGGMSLMGLSSLYPRLAMGLLVTHLALFFLAFTRMA